MVGSGDRMIEKGRDWGRPGTLQPGSPVFDHDHELGAFLEAGGTGTVGIVGGDLARTLGIAPDRDPGGAGVIVPIDAIRVALDGQPSRIAVAHIVVGRWWLSTRFETVMNAAFVGAANIAPRAHPGDGRLDRISFELPVGDRFEARRRLRTGTHVPHPGISVRRTTGDSIELDRPQPVRVDGRPAGRHRTIRFEVLSPAVEIAL